MFPHEAQELMAKVMFIIFATIMLCMIKINAADLYTSARLLVETTASY